MPWAFTIKFTDERPAGLSVRDWREVKRGANEDMGRVYQTFLPGHFKPGASQKYGYAKRTNAYINAFTGRKRKAQARGEAIAGPETPLVFTGLLRTSVVGFGRVRGFPGRMTFYAPAPKYVPERPKPDSKQPPIASEVTRTTPEERRRLEERLALGIRVRENVVRSRRARLIR